MEPDVQHFPHALHPRWLSAGAALRRVMNLVDTADRRRYLLQRYTGFSTSAPLTRPKHPEALADLSSQ